MDKLVGLMWAECRLGPHESEAWEIRQFFGIRES